MRLTIEKAQTSASTLRSGEDPMSTAPNRPPGDMLVAVRAGAHCGNDDALAALSGSGARPAAGVVWVLVGLPSASGVRAPRSSSAIGDEATGRNLWV